MRHKLDLSPQTQLLAALLGSSLALAIQQVTATNDFDLTRAVLAVAIMSSAANFFHGKSQILIDPFTSTRLAARVGAQILMNTSNLIIFVCFSLMAARLGSARWVLTMMLVLRIVGIIVVAFDLRILDKSVGKEASNEQNPFHKQRILWLVMDVTFVAFCLMLLLAGRESGLWNWHIGTDQSLFRWTALVFTVLISVEIFFEYVVFGSLYFSRGANWDALAERWDRLQGRDGDWYRTRLIHPVVSREIKNRRPVVVVDLGSGNGCTSRYVRDLHRVPVLGIDSSSDLVELAELYEGHDPFRGNEGATVSYFAASVEKMEQSSAFMNALSESRKRDGSALFIAVFSFQDVDDFEKALSAVTATTRASDRLLVVTESFTSFDSDEPHSTTLRHWKYSYFKKSNRQLVYWRPVTTTQTTSLFYDTDDEPGLIAVETAYLSHDDFRKMTTGTWSEVESGPVLLDPYPKDIRELKYNKNPKFEFLLLERLG